MTTHQKKTKKYMQLNHIRLTPICMVRPSNVCLMCNKNYLNIVYAPVFTTGTPYRDQKHMVCGVGF